MMKGKSTTNCKPIGLPEVENVFICNKEDMCDPSKWVKVDLGKGPCDFKGIQFDFSMPEEQKEAIRKLGLAE